MGIHSYLHSVVVVCIIIGSCFPVGIVAPRRRVKPGMFLVDSGAIKFCADICRPQHYHDVVEERGMIGKCTCHVKESQGASSAPPKYCGYSGGPEGGPHHQLPCVGPFSVAEDGGGCVLHKVLFTYYSKCKTSNAENATETSCFLCKQE
eukprot:PhF_6_TR29947/c0_g1_i1/m.43878